VFGPKHRALTDETDVLDEVGIDTVLGDESVEDIKIDFQRLDFDLQILSQELPLVMMIEELIGSLGTRLQEPDGGSLNHSNQGQIFGFLLIPQNDHAVVWVVHLCLAFVGFASVEIVLDEILVYRVLSKHFVVVCEGLAFVFGEPIPDVAPVFVRNAWGNRVVFYVHCPGQEHVNILDFLVNFQPLVVRRNAAKDVTLVDADLFDLLDSCLVA
jgi:hypothetical protein